MFHPSERIALAAEDRHATEAEWLRLVSSLHADPGFWWLDSAMLGGRLGRISFAGTDPYLWLSARGGKVEIDVRREIRAGLAPGLHESDTNAIEMARALLPRADSLLYSTRGGAVVSQFDWTLAPETPDLSARLDLPFLSGAVGYFGYELASQIEPRLCFDNVDDLGLPDLCLAFVDRVVAYDHQAERLWCVGLGFGDAAVGEERQACERAIRRSRQVVDRLGERVASAFVEVQEQAATPSSESGSLRLFPTIPAATELTIESTTDASGYAKAADSVLEEIGKGNVYQANYSQRLCIDLLSDPWDIYTELRKMNPAPFGAYLSLPGDVAILSSSPERFLCLDPSGRVETRPIKGTRPRGETEFDDARLEEELHASGKDRAENLMIVDLVRNDLGRVCVPGSIEVSELMQIEAYAAVFQMVSTVTGTLAMGRDAFDLIEGTFPPGSMTGAPKLASMELLERLESVRRGVYAGALGYLDLRGGLDLSVVIRTLVCREGRGYLHVGGGIVADSLPAAEYLESLDKARAPLAALEACASRAGSEPK